MQKETFVHREKYLNFVVLVMLGIEHRAMDVLGDQGSFLPLCYILAL